MGKSKQFLLSLAIPLAVLIAWHLTTTFSSVSPSILPRIRSVAIAFGELWHSGTLQKDIAVSLLRVLRGYGFSIVIGIVLGTLMGMSRTIWGLFHFTTTAIRQIPNIAWIPLIILWCGIKELSKTVIIVLAAFFPIMTNTLNGISSTPKGYIELSKLYKLNKWQTFKKVFLPYTLPHILVGLKLGLGSSWMAVVAAELIASSSGIGYRLSDARSLMRSDVVITCMIVIGFIGVIMDKLLSLLFTALTPWQKKNAGV